MKRKCLSCGIVESEVAFRDGECYECGGRSEMVGPFYVNTYLVDRAYGGSEEGGWWYDCGEPIDSRLCDSYEEMQKVKEEMEARCARDNKGRRPLCSVLSSGVYQVHTEDHFAEFYPQRRPYYE